MDWTKYFTSQAQSRLGNSFPFTSHYSRHIGGGFYAGVKRQQGYGLGGLLAKLGRYVLPILKPMAKSIGKQAIHSGVQMAGDIIEGHNPKQAFKQNFKQGARELFKKVVKKKNPPKKIVKRKRKAKSVVSSKLKRARKQDIFD